MDEKISTDSLDFGTNVDLASTQSLHEPAAISVERLARRHYKIPEELASRLDKASHNVRPLLHSLSPDLGWSSVAQKVRVHRIPGDHNTIIESAGLNRISDLILSSENCSPDA